MPKSEGTAQEDLDFWEFVTCSRCFLPFNLEPSGAPSVPFWLTECGHVLCNNHIKPDRSCAKCGEKDVQVTPLQAQMEQPMSTWFTAVPQSLYAAAFAASFQYNQLASLVRHYKRKCSQQRTLIENMKASAQKSSELHSILEELQEENRQLREYIQEPSDMRNVHRKRPMQSFNSSVSRAGSSHAHSSPRVGGTPLPPDRLTLPPSHQQPNFSTGHSLSDDIAQVEVDRQSRAAGFTPSNERPGSRRISEQYAYAPPSGREPQAIPSASLAHSQYHPVRQAHGRRQHTQNKQHTSMLPPSSESQHAGKFKPGAFRPPGPSANTSAREATHHHTYRTSEMPPPPVLPRSGAPLDRSSDPTSTPRFVSSRSDYATSSEQPRMATPLPGSLATQRFVPSTPSRRQQMLAPTAVPGSASRSHSNMQSQAFDDVPVLNSRAPSRLAGGQRMPFMPGA